jgi:hypothetical protein
MRSFHQQSQVESARHHGFPFRSDFGRAAIGAD